jgi:branched-chain amino acid aminotransferase
VKPSWLRWYSLKTDDPSIKNLPGLDPSRLSITETITPKELVPPEELIFGRTFTGKALARVYGRYID